MEDNREQDSQKKKKRKDRPRDPILVDIYLGCREMYGPDITGEVRVALIRGILLHYNPNTLHRLASSGPSCTVRETAAHALELIGHKQ